MRAWGNVVILGCHVTSREVYGATIRATRHTVRSRTARDTQVFPVPATQNNAVAGRVSMNSTARFCSS